MSLQATDNHKETKGALLRGALFLGGRRAALAAASALWLIAAAVPASRAADSDLGVSFPADPVTAQAGQHAQGGIRISNSGRDTLTVDVSVRQVLVGDNGQTRFTSSEDPLFAGRVKINPSHLVLAPQTYAEVSADIDIPASLPPDIYLVGLLVIPVPAPGQVRVVNEIGGLVYLNLPGPRNRQLNAVTLASSLVTFAGSGATKIRVENTGQAAVRFTTEAFITGGPAGPKPSDIRVPPKLLPPGHFRDVPLTWKSPIGLGLYHLKARILYDKTEHSNAEVDLSKDVVVVHPAYVAALQVLLGLWILILIRRRRKERREGGPKS